MSKNTPKTPRFEVWAAKTREKYEAAVAAESPLRKGAKKKRLRPEKEPRGVLYRRCYRYYRKLERDEELAALAQHLAADPSGRWIRHKREGIANVLRLLEKAGEKALLTSTRRNRMTLELDFAADCGIHDKLLLAFLYEAGAHQDILQASKRKDPGSWIKRYQAISKLITDDENRSIADSRVSSQEDD